MRPVVNLADKYFHGQYVASRVVMVVRYESFLASISGASLKPLRESSLSVGRPIILADTLFAAYLSSLPSWPT